MDLRAPTTLLAVALTLAACGDAPGGDPGGGGEVSESERLYVLANCTTCHGRDGEGSQLGPPLRGLAAHWTRDTLADYLADPKGTIANDERLQQLGESYRMMPMPPVLYEREQRLLIADRALELSAAAE